MLELRLQLFRALVVRVAGVHDTVFVAIEGCFGPPAKHAPALVGVRIGAQLVLAALALPTALTVTFGQECLQFCGSEFREKLGFCQTDWH